MDALCFVLGIQSTSLRANKITDFIYHSSEEEEPEEPTTMYVEAFFRKTDLSGAQDAVVSDQHGETSELSFLRMVSSDSGTSTYLINGVKKSLTEYTEALRHIGIDTSLRNFLVFQGDIDSIAIMTPQQRTLWFERMSRSEDFKDEYERLKEEYEQNDYETNLAMTKKRAVSHEQRLFKLQKEESEKFQQLLDERVSLYSFVPHNSTVSILYVD